MREHWSYRFSQRKDGSCRWLIGSWYWWRHNHGMPFWAAVRMTFRASVIWPLNNVRCWILLRSPYRRWQMRRLHRQLKELEERMDD